MAHKLFEYPITIREYHLDTFGHVNNARYLDLFEEARWELITKNGYGLKKVMESQRGPTIMEIKIRFKKELRLRTSIVIKTQLESYKGKVGILRQWMDVDGETYCDVEMTFGLFDLKLRKLIEPTPEWKTAIGWVE